jgi:hypothetical protein
MLSAMLSTSEVWHQGCVSKKKIMVRIEEMPNIAVEGGM